MTQRWSWELDTDLMYAEQKMVHMINCKDKSYYEIVLAMYLYYISKHMQMENLWRSIPYEL